MIEKKGGMMHAYANSKAHCTADWGQILINQLFALPSSKTQTAQSWTQSRDVLKCYCKMHRQWTYDERFFSKISQKIGRFGQMGQMNCGVFGVYPVPVKGQLISKCPFGDIVWTKIPTKFFPEILP